MKKAVYFTILMIAILIVLPLLIVKGCGYPEDKDGIPKTQTGASKIKVYVHSEDRVVEMDLEEYVKGVVAAEMPAAFPLEALKAQAVAARTYALLRMEKVFPENDERHNGADICTDSGHCQAWTSKSAAMKKWGIFSAAGYWNKIEKAVSETQALTITYNGSLINPVFHANSGGKTENAEEVWEGGEYPYLKSVTSRGEDAAPDFKTTITVTAKEFADKLKKEYPEIKLNQSNLLKDIKILSYTTGGRVKTVKIGNINVKGTDFRKIFSLKSANFKIEKGEGNKLTITTLGNGHGVGMSQWGANYLAKNGKSFEEIIKYYYNGVELSKMKE